jgi:hypothetical protein
MKGIVKGEVIPPMPAWQKAAITVGIGAAAFLGYGFYLAGTPEGRQRSAERDAIRAICVMQDDALQELSARRYARAECRRLTAAYRERWGSGP